MKRLLFFLFGLNSFCFAQPDTNDFDHVFYSRESMIDFVFGEIPNSLTPTNFLLDQNELIENSWEKYSIDYDGYVDSSTVENWFELYKFLSRASRPGNELMHRDTANFEIISRLFAKDPTADYLRLPLMNLNFKVNRFKDDAIQKGSIVFDDSHYSPGSNPQDGIDVEQLFFAGLWLDTLEFSGITIYYDDFFIQSNSGIDIVNIEIDHNQDSYILNDGGEVDLDDFFDGWNTIHLKFNYTNGTFVETDFSFYKMTINKSLQATDSELLHFDVVGNINVGNDGDEDPNNPSLTYCIEYSCDNNTGKVKKPVFFIAGFGMGSPYTALTKAGQKDCVDLISKYNINGLVNELRNTGHDIIVVRFVPAIADIKKDAELLASLIQLINIEKFENNSYFENIIIGYSAGAMTARYCLDLMEKNHLENGTPHHHSKLYVSFEGEHNGAYIPLGTQSALVAVVDEYPSIQTFVIYYMANSPQAKQLLKYFHTETGIYGTSNSSGQSPHSLRQDFLNDMESDANLGHSKQYEKYGYYGFPAFSRNVSIANGSRFTSVSTPPEVSNTPYLYEPGQIVFENQGVFNLWRVKFGYNSNLVYMNTPFTVFRLVHWNLWGSIIYDLNFQTNSDIVMWGNAPGGFLYDKEDMQKTVFSKMNLFIGGGSADVHNYLPNCFTPTTANHAIRNFEPWSTGDHYDPNYRYHVVYDFQDENLMFQDFGAAAQSDFYGYPVLGNPGDHFEITPFEAIYTDEWNQVHISSFDAILSAPVYPEPSDIGTSGFPTIKDFIISEVQPYITYLQNQQIGWNTDGSDYKAEYESSDNIVIGEEVTPKTDIAPYEIWENGDISCRAGSYIAIKPGFHAQNGSVFHAKIEQPDYVQCIPEIPGLMMEPGSISPSNTFAENNTISQSGQNYSEEVVSNFRIIPNPTNGEFRIVFDEDSICPMYIFDLSGKLVWSGNIYSNQNINPNLDAGVYVIRVKGVENEYVDKLIIR